MGRKAVVMTWVFAN